MHALAWPRPLEEGKPDLEQFFHVPGAAFVDQEQNHVVVGLDHQVIVGDQHLPDVKGSVMLLDEGQECGMILSKKSFTVMTPMRLCAIADVACMRTQR